MIRLLLIVNIMREQKKCSLLSQTALKTFTLTFTNFNLD